MAAIDAITSREPHLLQLLTVVKALNRLVHLQEGLAGEQGITPKPWLRPSRLPP